MSSKASDGGMGCRASRSWPLMGWMRLSALLVLPSIVDWAAGGTVSGATAGVLTGVPLVRLLRQPLAPGQEAPQE